MYERMRRRFDQARERWQGNASADALPDGPRPTVAELARQVASHRVDSRDDGPRPARQNAMPLRPEDAQEQARIYQETQRRLREQRREE